MKHLLLVILASLFLGVSIHAQTTTPKPQTTMETKARKPIFRATKDQIIQVQRMLKTTESGSMDDLFRIEIKKYQSSNGLKSTGTLNRATLEKMGVPLTEGQKAIPVDPNSFASADSNKTTKRGPVFRATKDQVTAAQNLLKSRGLLSAEPTGKLDPETRAALKAYQETNGLKATGTLNQTTLEKMGIALTDKQRENASKASQ
ncbi:MAG: peptidoglycan-binding protein [Acidobacteria bacterium]|nr:peptidoglycan-binding protein [Acidobacteriota bacterium]MBK8149746.1 peptidoglycan-binding protein [Acidobacteriota bacterium]MBK8809872.1 peptidoglycan-binding protein [Acidobacteriota bacterium]